uniref:Uncharacterized protein n=1 Tax=Auxenochlorella protothecoides TaxID=3075 RepID=A0A1D2A1X4_AUXPR
METTVVPSDEASRQNDVSTSRTGGSALRSLLSRAWPQEDTGYAPRRLSSPSFKDRLLALRDILLCKGLRRNVANNNGTGQEQIERDRRQLPSLVEAGRHAGRSRVVFSGSNINLHLWIRDSFISIVQNKTRVLILAFFIIYQLFFWSWGSLYYLLVRFKPGCIYGADSFVEAWVFAVVTQMTIGYGNTGPQNCWPVSVMIVVQGILSVLLGAMVVGIMFARISHPHYRGRSIYMSDRASIARRDGTLKLMFRIADIRRTQVVEPHVKTFLYTWGSGRVTAEGEKIPVRCEALDIGYIDGMLLLPLIIEHTIDERSPLCGHTHDSLTSLNAEIVVTFEGTTEFGNPFMARRSYLPHELHWGEQFLPIIMRPEGSETNKHYGVDLTHFHDLRRQKDVPSAPASEVSHAVVSRALKTVPYPLLGENTLVVSDSLCVSWTRGGALELVARVGDTYPNQMVEVVVHFILYRWCRLEDQQRDPLLPTFTQHRLDVGYNTGADRLNLRLPVDVRHVIDARSPLANWLEPGGVDSDLGSEIVVIMNGYRTRSTDNVLRQRTYNVGQHVRWGHRFVPIVRPPGFSGDGKARVRWGKFHAVVPDTRKEVDGHAVSVPGGPRIRLAKATPASLAGTSTATVRAPESHAPRRAQAAHAAGGEEERRIAADVSEMLSRMPSRLGPGAVEASDYTILPMDLHRYAAEIASMSLLPARSLRPGLPRFFGADGGGQDPEADPLASPGRGPGPLSPGAHGPPLRTRFGTPPQVPAPRPPARPTISRSSPFSSAHAAATGDASPPGLASAFDRAAAAGDDGRAAAAPLAVGRRGPHRSGSLGAEGSETWAGSAHSGADALFVVDEEEEGEGGGRAGSSTSPPGHASPRDRGESDPDVGASPQEISVQHPRQAGTSATSTPGRATPAGAVAPGSLDAVPEDRAMQDSELSLNAPLVAQSAQDEADAAKMARNLKKPSSWQRDRALSNLFGEPGGASP